MAQYAARAINDKVRFSAAQVFFQQDGAVGIGNLGNMKEVTYTPEIQEWEDWSRQHGTKSLIGTYPIQKGATVAISTTTWTELIYSMMLVSSSTHVTRTASTTTLEFPTPIPGSIFYTGLKKSAVTSADDGEAVDPIDWIEGTHFTFHELSGVVEILSVPVGATNLKIEVEVKEIALEDGITKFQAMSSSGITGKLIIVGTNEFGAKGEFVIGKVKFLPSNGFASVGGDEGDTASLTGRVYEDDNGSFGDWTSYEKL